MIAAAEATAPTATAAVLRVSRVMMLITGSRVTIQMNALYAAVPAGTVARAARNQDSAMLETPAFISEFTFSVQVVPPHPRNWAALVGSGCRLAGIDGVAGGAVTSTPGAAHSVERSILPTNNHQHPTDKER
jgi:hypothetical protein